MEAKIIRNFLILFPVFSCAISILGFLYEDKHLKILELPNQQKILLFHAFYPMFLVLTSLLSALMLIRNRPSTVILLVICGFLLLATNIYVHLQVRAKRSEMLI